MEMDILKHFVNKHVELLVGGTWIEGQLQPIVKGTITLVPVGVEANFYGPAAMKTEVVQAIRLLKKPLTPPVVREPTTDPNVRSSLDQITPANRFKKEK